MFENKIKVHKFGICVGNGLIYRGPKVWKNDYKKKIIKAKESLTKIYKVLKHTSSSNTC